MRTIKLKIKFSILGLSVLIIVFSFVGCNSTKDSFKYVDATVDDLLGKKFEAILIRIVDDPDKTHFMAVIGDIDNAEKIVQHQIKAEKVIDASWVKRIASGFQNAERWKTGCIDDVQAIFLTKTRGYMIKYTGSDKVIYGPDFKSEQLWKYFEEVGLLSEHSKPPDMSEVIKALK
jgi:hypothetical protein